MTWWCSLLCRLSADGRCRVNVAERRAPDLYGCARLLRALEILLRVSLALLIPGASRQTRFSQQASGKITILAFR